MKKNIYLFFGLSILLNAFLCGFIASQTMMRSPHDGFDDGRGPPPMPPEHFMNQMIKEQSLNLSSDSQLKIIKIIKTHDNQASRPQEDIIPLLKDMKSILIADKIDNKKLTDIRQKIAQKEMSHHLKMDSLIDDIIKSLPKEDRIQFFSDLFPFDRPFPPPPARGNHFKENNAHNP